MTRLRRHIFLSLFLIGTTTAHAAIAVDNTTSSTASSTSLTFLHTVGAGSNRLLLVAVVTGSSTTASSEATTVSTVTYGGTSLTQAGTVVEQGNRVRAYIFRMVNPPSGTANVVVTQNSTRRMHAGATSFTGVHQTTPLGTFSNSAGTPPGQLGRATSASLTGISSATGQIVYYVLGLDSPHVGTEFRPTSVRRVSEPTVNGSGSRPGRFAAARHPLKGPVDEDYGYSSSTPA